MTIKNGYEISYCTSEIEPQPKLDCGTFYLPVGVSKESDELYHYNEYRFNLPVDYPMPVEVYGLLCNALVKESVTIKEISQRQDAVEAAVIELAEIVGGETDG